GAFSPEPAVAIVGATAERPDAVLPGQGFPLQLNVTNLGTARARDVRLELDEGGAPVPAFSLAPGESLPVSAEVTAPLVAPRGEAEPEEAYRARLESADGRALSYGYSLDWATSCGSRLGPIDGSVRTFLVLPLVTVSLEGPAEAREGDTLRYTLTLRNEGYADASGLVLTVVPPEGTPQEVTLPVGALARGARIQVPFTHTLPELWSSEELAVAVAHIRWSDEVGNAYGPLSGSARTRVQRANRPPLVEAGPDQSLTLPATATLEGTVVDDGLPEGAELTEAWVQVSGPAQAWFADASKAATTVTFPEPGTYVLRLIGSDSQLTASDELTVTVRPREGNGTTLPGGTPAESESLINVVRDGNQVRLDNTARAFNFIWVAVSSKGTIVKIDTRTGAVLGEYWTSPVGQPKDPSRTTVDKNGNAWAGNRAGNSVVHIGLLENGQCVDRNGNGVIDTSQGLNDIRAWPNWNGVDTNGGISTAEDECILHYVRVSSRGTRHLSVNAENDLWVSGTGWGSWKFDLIDGRTGLLKRHEKSVGYGG
ncbi:MAG TPA: hypothetical protein VLQ93_04230, partial [Myxococcaceae bacterium]|nr:hypothetical protein [Myxococcaceae bacterium]